MPVFLKEKLKSLKNLNNIKKNQDRQLEDIRKNLSSFKESRQKMSEDKYWKVDYWMKFKEWS